MPTTPTISELVRERIAGGYNTSTLQDLSGSADLPAESRVLRQQFDALADGEVSGWPRQPDKIKGYAAALGVDERTVVLAFARQLGIEVRENQSALASMLPATAERLSTAQSVAIADLVRVFTRQSERTEEPQSTPPDLHGAPGDEMRQIMDLWTELAGRAADAPPHLARMLQHLAQSVDTAIQNSKR